MRTLFRVILDGEVRHEGDELTLAIRAWDASTFRGAPVNGGIEVQTWRDDVMVRDGWVLHVEDSRVYLNPNLALT